MSVCWSFFTRAPSDPTFNSAGGAGGFGVELLDGLALLDGLVLPEGLALLEDGADVAGALVAGSLVAGSLGTDSLGAGSLGAGSLGEESSEADGGATVIGADDSDDDSDDDGACDGPLGDTEVAAEVAPAVVDAPLPAPLFAPLSFAAFVHPTAASVTAATPSRVVTVRRIDRPPPVRCASMIVKPPRLVR